MSVTRHLVKIQVQGEIMTNHRLHFIAYIYVQYPSCTLAAKAQQLDVLIFCELELVGKVAPEQVSSFVFRRC